MDLHKAYPKMSQDRIQTYKLTSLVGSTGVVGTMSVFGDQRSLPTNNRYLVYGITSLSEYYANVPSSMTVRLRNDWITVTDIYNAAKSTTNIMTESGLIVPTHTAYMTLLSNDVLVLAVMVSKEVGTTLYLNSYSNTHLMQDEHMVTRTSLRYSNFNDLERVTPGVLDTLYVNGFYRPITQATYTIKDDVELIKDQHVVMWDSMCLRKCGSTTINNELHTVVKLHSGNTILNHNDCEFYLCTGKSNDCSTSCEPTAADYGALIMNLNNDFITLTHQYVAISNVPLKKAHALLRTHPNYDNGDVYLRWTVKEHPDAHIINKHHMRVLGAMDYTKAIRVLADDQNEFTPWKAQTLAASTVATWLNGSDVDINDLLNDFGHIGLSHLFGNSMHYGPTVIDNAWDEYVVIKYNPLVTAYNPNTVRNYDHPHYEIVPGVTVYGLGYNEYQNEQLSAHDRIYAHDNGVLVDITDETDKIDRSSGTAVPVNGFPSVLHIRSLKDIVLYSVDIPTDDYITDDVLIEHDEALNGHVTLWINGRSMINGLDYHVHLKTGSIRIYSPSYDYVADEQNIVIMVKPTINGTTAMSHVGIYDDDFGLPRLNQVRDEMIVTHAGKRDTPANAVITNNTFYGIEYAPLHFTSHISEDTLALQHSVDKAVDMYTEETHHTGTHTLVSPFMNRVFNIAIAAADDVLRLINTYGEIHNYLENYLYILETEPRATISEHLYKHIRLIVHPSIDIMVTSTQYDFIERIAVHYELDIDLDNVSIQPHT